MTTSASATAAARPLRATTLAAYGLFGMPLAMAALPLYVHLPQFYGGHLGVNLGVLGGLLLALRLLDGVIDPMLGVWSDRRQTRKRWIAIAAPLLAVGMVALFMPPARGGPYLLFWLAASLALVYAAFSLATINHQAWGAELSTDPVERTHITAVREGLSLIGVVIAAVLPSFLGDGGRGDAGLGRFALLFGVFTLLCAAITVNFTANPAAPRSPTTTRSMRQMLAQPLADRLFRKLLLVFMLNGIAAAIPATLVLFFIGDVLAATSSQGTFLALYFIAGAAGMPLWVRLSSRVGKARAWLAAMALAIVSFVWASTLGAGDSGAFTVICVLSGLALGADLALPPSLLADVIGRGGSMIGAGSYFGLWTLATKLNLALAAGIALPLLSGLGYVPGGRDPAALRSLAVVYALVPCVLKLGAIAALFWFSRKTDQAAPRKPLIRA